MEQQTQVETTGNKKFKINWGIVIGLGAVVLLIALIMNFNPEANAKRAAEKAITEVLVSPSSAKFSGMSDTKIEPGILDDTYEIEGWVESENTYGAKIRSDYYAEVEKENGKWEVTDYDIDNPIDDAIDEIDEDLDEILEDW